MYQPYPGGAQMPEVSRPPVPKSVQNAVKFMYVGAALSLIGIAVDLATPNATKRAIEKRSPRLTISQVNSREHALLIVAIVIGLIAAGVWFWLARSSLRGKNWARITGTVLFALYTIDNLVSLGLSTAGLVHLYGLLGWLIGLGAVVFLWRRDSTAFFKAPPPA
jgi:hypothetical protein